MPTWQLWACNLCIIRGLCMHCSQHLSAYAAHTSTSLRVPVCPQADWERALRTSTTLYIGNLSFYTREEQIYEVFSKCGHIDRIIVGLDKLNKTPCGFAFVIYYARADAEAAVRYLSGTVLDDRAIRVDHDWGFMEGRQWGRGRSGGQVRDCGQQTRGTALTHCGSMCTSHKPKCPIAVANRCCSDFFWLFSLLLSMLGCCMSMVLCTGNEGLVLPRCCCITNVVNIGPHPQVRDEFRLDYDPGRGGYGKVVQKEITNMQQKMVSGSMTSSPAFTAPAGKRQRMDGPGQGQGGYGGRGRDDTNPRFADRGRRADSDDDDRD